MPLPEKWSGHFWSKDTGGDYLFDMTPDEFITFAKQADENVPFLVAGAYVDLMLNDHVQLAGQFLNAGRAHYPNCQWSELEAKAKVWRSGSDTKNVANEVAGLFDDIQLFVIPFDKKPE